MTDTDHRAMASRRNELRTASDLGTAAAPSSTGTKPVMVGLHGHPLAANMARVTVAEAVGTFTWCSRS
jgi:hypothetical protein